MRPRAAARAARPSEWRSECGSGETRSPLSRWHQASARRTRPRGHSPYSTTHEMCGGTGNTKRLRVAPRLLPRARLTVKTRWMTRPLCSVGFPRLLRSYGSLRPCASHWYAHPRGSTTWISPFTSRRQVPTFRTRASVRVTPPLCRVSSRQAAASPWIRPGPTTRPGFDTVPTLSTRLRWFTSVRLSDPQLTRSCRAVSNDAHHPGSLPEQLTVVWSLPCQPAPRGRPSSLVQQGCVESAAFLHHGLLSAPSWRTIVRVSNEPSLQVPALHARAEVPVEQVIGVGSFHPTRNAPLSRRTQSSIRVAAGSADAEAARPDRASDDRPLVRALRAIG